MSVLHCDVVAKDRMLFSGELYSITVPGVQGYMGVLEITLQRLLRLKMGSFGAEKLLSQVQL